MDLRRRRMLRPLIGVAIALSLLVPPAFAQESGTALVVVLVDESGSLNRADFREEVAAASALDQIAGADVAVFGFGSDGPSREAVVQVCGIGDELSSCTGDLVNRRSSAEGWDTDFASAFRAASTFLEGKSGYRQAIVLLMTDGKFDPDGRRNPNATQLAALDQALELFRSVGGQVWPVGFGDADVDELQRLAAAGAVGECADGSPAPAPTPIFATTATDPVSQVNRIVGLAACRSVAEGGQLKVDAFAQLGHRHLRPVRVP